MANLGRRNGIYHVRFRFRGKEFKKSLKVRDKDAAEAARLVVELTIHRLMTGQVQLAEGVDVGDFIVSGGTITQPQRPVHRLELPSTRALVQTFLDDRVPLVSESYHGCLGVHLRTFLGHLGSEAECGCEKVHSRKLTDFVQARLKLVSPVTVDKERDTLVLFYKWAVAQGHLATSPAAGLPPIKGGKDRPPFRTLAEIGRIAARGGLNADEELDLWECLFLSPAEIAGLLALVRENARDDVTYLLHAIPAYTGMRRGEVLRLRWLDVDFDDDFVTAHSRKQSRSKTETGRRIDLHPELKSELLEWRQRRPKGQFVICDVKTLEPTEIHRANRCFWQPLRGTEWCLDSKKNWFKIGFHTYRHSFASNLASKGVDQRIIDEFMGHTTEAMRRRYRHLFPKDRRSAIECFSLAAPTVGESQDSG